MADQLIKILEKLTSFPAVSGNEVALHGYLKELLEKEANRMWVDEKGNFIAVKGENPKIALFAHADKVGFMVQQVGKDGIGVVQLKKGTKPKWPVGPVAEVVIVHRGESDLVAKGVLINKSDIDGIKDLWLEVGDKERIKVGDMVGFKPNFSSDGKTIVSQGLDNKVGLLVAIEVFKQVEECMLIASAREEMPSKSVSTAAFSLMPKMAIVVDVTYATDLVAHGEGPAICLKDNLLPDLKVVKSLEEAAMAKKLTFQYEVLEEGGSEAVAIENVAGGIPFTFVGVPLSFMHTPFEKVELVDIKSAIGLLKALVEGK